MSRDARHTRPQAVKQKRKRVTGSQKVRRDFVGGKRGDGDRRSRRIVRPRASKIRRGAPDPSLTAVAGLVPFGAYLEELGVDRELRTEFFKMKSGPLVVYPMEAQVRLLIDANAVGEQRVFGIEALAADPLFVQLAGGVVPSIDTVYRDLERFDEDEVAKAEEMMARHGTAVLQHLDVKVVHVDIDTTVETVFGRQDGAELGYNPRYHGRPSYHPLLAFLAETGSCVGALLRPGNTALGGGDADLIGHYVRRVMARVSKGCRVVARIDSGGDCAEILAALNASGASFVTKARLTVDLLSAVISITDADWKTVDEDADAEPLVQVTELAFQRKEWTASGNVYRVVAVRRRDRDSGQQVQLWKHLDYSVQVFITNDLVSAPEDVAATYDGRAEVEPRIAELKGGIGIGKVPTHDFDANHAALQIKLLTHNLVRRYVLECVPELASWRMPWIGRALFRVPGRLVRSGRQTQLRVPPRSMLQRALR
jgi:hypothetical protein